MKRYTLVAAGIAGLAILHGCSFLGKLGRSEARGLIQEYLHEKKFDVGVMTIRTGRFEPGFGSLGGGGLPYEALSSAGLLKYSETLEREEDSMFDKRTIEVTLTDKGKPFILNEEVEDRGTKMVRVKQWTLEIKEVTGIQFADGERSAVVHFNWDYDETTPFHEACGLSVFTKALQEKGGKTGAAAMQLFDDGWRVVQVDGSWRS